MTPQQEKLRKMKRLADLTIGKEVAVATEFNKIDTRIDKVEEKIEDIKSQIPDVQKALDRVEALVDGEKGEQGERGGKGDKGDTGKDGRDGKDGKDGKDGVNGKDGRDGKDGKDGIDGKDGADGFVDEATIGYLEEKMNSIVEKVEEQLKNVPTKSQLPHAVGIVVREVQAGTGVTIDNSNPLKPIVSASVTGGAWGGITGTLSNQTDLQNALNAKANALGADDNYVTDAEKTALHSHSNKTALDNVSGTNTGDETTSTIKTKLGITTLSGSNTGDQTIKDVFGITVDGGGSTPSTGTKGYRYIEQNCTITGWHVQGDVSGSIVFDVKRGGTSIAGTEKPTLSSQTSNSDTALTTWTTSLTAGDIIEFVIDSASTLTRATLTVLVTKI